MAIPVTITALDLTTAKPLAPPGTLQRVLNYERSAVEGASRIHGIERHDGTPGPWSAKFVRMTSTQLTGEFVAGMTVYTTLGYEGYVLDVWLSEDELTTYIDAVFSDVTPVPSLPATLTGTDGASAPLTSYAPIDAPRGMQSTLNTALAALATWRRSSITDVPGRQCTDILHLFMLRGQLYAVRDLPRVYWTGGDYGDVNEGRYLTIGAAEYEVLNVTPTGLRTGYLTLDTASGSGVDVVATGSTTVGYVSLTPGTLLDANPGLSYSDGVTAAGGVSPYTYSIVGHPGHRRDPVPRPNPDAPDFGRQRTDAALYKATASGWERVNLGREIPFRSGTAQISNFARDITMESAPVQDTGFVFPSSSVYNAAVTTAINADDGALANLTGATGDWMFASDFDFSSIPDTAVIRGIEVVIERRSDTANQARDQRVDLLGLSTGPTVNKAKSVAWPNTIGTVTYGGPNDLWGENAISVWDVQNGVGAGFGVRLIVERAASGTATIGGVDYIKVKVYYVTRDQPAYVWDGATDVPITVRHTQILTGDAGSYEGWMSITAAQHADKPRLINDGDEIRTAASGGGDLLAVAAGRDKPIWLPGQVDIDNNGARYETIVENFWFQDDYDAAFTVQGVGPAWYFDGERTIRIRVPLTDLLDAPRHVVRHGERLMLGYYPGLTILTPAGDPFETRGEEGAQPKGFGDRIVGLMRLGGDQTAVLCERSVATFAGYTEESFITYTSAPKQGALEYTATDLGRVLALDATGVFPVTSRAENTPETPRDYLSELVRPWLEQRLSAGLNAQQNLMRPIAALTVPNLRQVWWTFWDGYVLTMTDVAGVPYWYIRRYYEPSAAADNEDDPWPIRAMCSGIDADGRERIFVAFYARKEGYVFDAAAGRAFDGAEIPAFCELNPISGGQDMLQKQHDRVFVHGMGEGYATLSHSRSVDLREVDTSVSQTTTMGASTDAVSLEREAMRGKVDLPAEGVDLTIRFDSSTATEAPHTLQMLTLFVEPRGQSRGHTRA